MWFFQNFEGGEGLIGVKSRSRFLEKKEKILPPEGDFYFLGKPPLGFNRFQNILLTREGKTYTL